MQGNLALLNQQGNGGMPFGHVLAYKADNALQLDFIKALSREMRLQTVRLEDLHGQQNQ